MGPVACAASTSQSSLGLVYSHCRGVLIPGERELYSSGSLLPLWHETWESFWETVQPLQNEGGEGCGRKHLWELSTSPIWAEKMGPPHCGLAVGRLFIKTQFLFGFFLKPSNSHSSSEAEWKGGKKQGSKDPKSSVLSLLTLLGDWAQGKATEVWADLEH